jgi:hypothetical protein
MEERAAILDKITEHAKAVADTLRDARESMQKVHEV